MMESVPAKQSSCISAKHISSKTWMSKVLQAQHQRNPEELDAARLRIERARQHEISARKCKAVKGLAIRSRALAAEGLKQMAESKAPDEYFAVQNRWQSAQQVSRARQEKKCKKLGKAKLKKASRSRSRSSSRSSAGSWQGRAAGRPLALERKASSDDDVASDCSGASRASVLRAASDSEEDAMEEAACLVGASDARAMKSVANEGLQVGFQPAPRPAAIAAVAANDQGDSEGYSDGGAEEEEEEEAGAEESEVDFSSAESENSAPVRRAPAPKPAGGASVVASLLSQLRQEPDNEEECAAKFCLYEGYASEVENMRNTLFKFHEESRPTLPSSIVTDMDRQIKCVDSEDAMRIPDRSREWFVYHMMRQAERNNLKMAGILDGFDKKLKFLAQNDQVECPVCLESFNSSTNAAETLGCCHKVCKECWHQWTKVMRGRAFCPLCRNGEFLGAVAARAAAPSAADSDSMSGSSDDDF
mmetsp:Transcript_64038/g.111576  ORF Transcript_64038/g.111576 Transcript_64038/m.111576 type:complete len:475 (+) Transcript_64038:91-1515(+)